MTQTLRSPQAAATWLRQRVRAGLHTDHRCLEPGDGLLAWPGARHDARRFALDALAQGAAACLVEHEGVQAFGFDDARIASYAGLKPAASRVADAFFEHPSQHLAVLAVTGTNGKTSTAWWLAQALSSTRLHSPIACAMIGTLGVGQPPATSAGAAPPAVPLAGSGLTTPDPVLLQSSLRRFADSGLRACAIEASSIGIDEHRLDGVAIHCAIYTNFTQDHLDYHGTMDAYWRAKARLFAWPGLKAAVLNLDDGKAAALLADLDVRRLDIWTTSCIGPARLCAQNIGHGAAGLCFDVVEGAARQTLRTQLIGHYNIANLLGVIATMRSLQVPLEQAVAACADLAPVPGRMQCLIAPGMPAVAIDYAHTPDALDKAIAALRPMAQARAGQLWCVFGCGGDRDPGKRPLMGAAAAQADHVVVTSDNPRGEDPLAIIAQIMPALAGHGSARQQADRAMAIEATVTAARPVDVVLLAGKGHEDYQEIAGTRRPFSDLALAQAALARRGAPAGAGA